MADAWVKLCGCTGWPDVELCIEVGADAFGMIFAPSPRRIEWDAAVEIARHVPNSIAPVAVFVNPPHQEVEAVRALFPQALLQFSGNESPAFVRRYGERAIKALPGNQDVDRIEKQAADFPSAALLFDSRDRGLAGGTGKTFAWERAAPIAARRRVIVAGGLNAANVAECLRTVRPFGIDVRSGIETHGRKDSEKMREFVRVVREMR
jgi:phosphoribosylanthranilate isomerase